jgi:hypothetical protein
MSGVTFNPFDPQRVTDLVVRVNAATKAQLISITLQETAENQILIEQIFGHPAPTQLFVDGQSGKPLSQAEVVTLTRFELHSNVIDAALKMLMERSPYGPDEGGHYRDDHWLFVNNIRRDATREGDMVQINPGDEAVIINMRPYARKLEGGALSRTNRLTNRRPGLSAQAPNGIYEITARDLQRKFGTVAIIRFAYRAIIGTGLVSTAAPARTAIRSSRGRFLSQGGPRPHNDPKVRFPALEIEMRPFA